MDPHCWTIVASYLEFRDKIALRGVCKATRKYNHILAVPKGIPMSDRIILSIPALTKLQELDAYYNTKITDTSVSKLTNLQELDASWNPNITDASVSKLANLEILYSYSNPNITIRLKKHKTEF